MQLNQIDHCIPPKKGGILEVVDDSSSVPPGSFVQIEMSLDAFLGEVDDLDWTEQAIMELMDGMIKSSLQSIRDKKFNSSSFAEEAAWFFDCFNDDHPFSARNCASVAGLDIDDIRRMTAMTLPMEKRRIIKLIDNGHSTA